MAAPSKQLNEFLDNLYGVNSLLFGGSFIVIRPKLSPPWHYRAVMLPTPPPTIN